MSHNIAILRAIASAQPISLPLPFQLSDRHQPAHLQPKTIPIPYDVEASTHSKGSTTQQGKRD